MRSDLTGSFLSTLENFDDTAEFALDELLDSDFLAGTLLDNETLKDIPGLNIVFGIRKLAINVRDHIFISNLLKFLKGYSEIPIVKRNKFIDRYFYEEDDKKYFSEKMITTLESLDFSKKVELIVLLLKKRIDNEIANEDFFDLLDVIRLVKYHWIVYFFDFAILRLELKRVITDHFYVCGLLQTLDSNGNSYTFSKNTKFKPSSIGDNFISIFYKDKNNDNYKRERLYFHFRHIKIFSRDLNNHKGEIFKGSFDEISKHLDKLPIDFLIKKTIFFDMEVSITLDDYSFQYTLFNLGSDVFILNIREKDLFLKIAK